VALDAARACSCAVVPSSRPSGPCADAPLLTALQVTRSNSTSSTPRSPHACLFSMMTMDASTNLTCCAHVLAPCVCSDAVHHGCYSAHQRPPFPLPWPLAVEALPGVRTPRCGCATLRGCTMWPAVRPQRRMPRSSAEFVAGTSMSTRASRRTAGLVQHMGSNKPICKEKVLRTERVGPHTFPHRSALRSYRGCCSTRTYFATICSTRT